MTETEQQRIERIIDGGNRAEVGILKREIDNNPYQIQ